MAYQFKGVFLKDSMPGPAKQLAAEIGHVRPIESPFSGLGISLRDELQNLSEEEERDLVLRLSEAMGDSTLVFIYYSTWGGPCEYARGFACKSGVILPGSEMAKEDDDRCEVLEHLMGCLGVSIHGGSYRFAPFERGFFPNT